MSSDWRAPWIRRPATPLSERPSKRASCLMTISRRSSKAHSTCSGAVSSLQKAVSICRPPSSGGTKSSPPSNTSGRRDERSGGGDGLRARCRLHDAQPLCRAQDARSPSTGSGMHHEGRAVRWLPRVLRNGSRDSAAPQPQAIASTSRACLTSSRPRSRSCLTGVILLLSCGRSGRRSSPTEHPQHSRFVGGLGRGRDDRLGLPVLQ